MIDESKLAELRKSIYMDDWPSEEILDTLEALLKENAKLKTNIKWRRRAYGEQDDLVTEYRKQLEKFAAVARSAERLLWRNEQEKTGFGEIDNLKDALAAYEKVRVGK